MAERVGKDIWTDQRLLRRASDPVHIEALLMIGEGPASAGAVAEHLGIDRGEAAAHLEQMRKLGLIEVIDSGQGGNEPRYRALVRSMWKNDEWARLSHEERNRLITWTLGVIDADAREALASGSFAERVDSHISRSVSVVDERGWRELCRIQEEALEEIFAVEAASNERLAERGKQGVSVMSAMLCCELPAVRREKD